MSRPRLLDLFCGAGGATRGYQLAGFHVTGVDINPQPRYIGDEFHQADALTFPLDGYDAIHASPPCQDYSSTRGLHAYEYPRLIAPVRDRLARSGSPYVIENVEGARREMYGWVRLCGSSFGLGVRRHRLFEVSFPILFAPPCAHYLQPDPVDVTGTGGPRRDSDVRRTRCNPSGTTGGNSRKPRNLAHARQVMGIDWMNRSELAEAIPPIYTEYIGRQMLATMETAA